MTISTYTAEIHHDSQRNKNELAVRHFVVAVVVVAAAAADAASEGRGNAEARLPER